jgi:hypothetical protein
MTKKQLVSHLTQLNGDWLQTIRGGFGAGQSSDGNPPPHP